MTEKENHSTRSIKLPSRSWSYDSLMLAMGRKSIFSKCWWEKLSLCYILCYSPRRNRSSSVQLLASVVILFDAWLVKEESFKLSQEFAGYLYVGRLCHSHSPDEALKTRNVLSFTIAKCLLRDIFFPAK